MSDKIFCMECLFLQTTVNSYNARESQEAHWTCKAPSNLKRSTTQTWLRKHVEVTPIRNPSVINKNNDCKWFENRHRNISQESSEGC